MKKSLAAILLGFESLLHIRMRCRAFLLLMLSATPALASFAAREAEVMGPTNKKVYVAFIFAGAPRSLVVPVVHESIRENMLRPLCPAPLCEPHIYARISRADNTHKPNDAVGDTTRVQNSVVDNAVMYALERVADGNKVITDYFDTGSAEEKKEMLDHANALNATSKMRHEVYRTFDPRRYSMHFARDRAYRLMARHEQDATQGGQYDWVVHLRMDMGWSDQISQPIFSFDDNHIYVPSMWFADTPDTFALVPRKLADTYFDIDGLILPPKVMCIGGPNFDPATASVEGMHQRGFTSEAAQTFVKNELCLQLFPGFHRAVHHKTNSTWSTAGYSEYLLKRKLQGAGIVTYSGNNGPFSGRSFVVLFLFPLFIVRHFPAGNLPRYRYLTASAKDSTSMIARVPQSATGAHSIMFLCFYLRARQHIPYAKTVSASNAAMHASCLHMALLHHDLARQSPWSTPCTVMARARRQVASELVKAVTEGSDLSERECHSLDATSTTALDRTSSDWNFMPFRLRFRQNKCVTSSDHRHVKKSNLFDTDNLAALSLHTNEDALHLPRNKVANVFIAPCINFYRHKEIMVSYQETQLMSFLPLLGATTTPQQIMVMPDHHTTLCLTMAYHRAASFMAASQGFDWTKSGAIPPSSVSRHGSELAEDGTGRPSAGPVEEVLFLSTCESFDWQRLHSFSPSEAMRSVRRAAHQLFVVDVLETRSATDRRQAAQRRMHQDTSDMPEKNASSTGRQSPLLDAVSAGMLRWSPSAIAELAAGYDGGAMPGAHATSADERAKASGDLCVTPHAQALSSRRGQEEGDAKRRRSKGRSSHNNVTGTSIAWEWWNTPYSSRPPHVGAPPSLVLRPCPVHLHAQSDMDTGLTSSPVPGGHKKSLGWLADNISSIHDFYNLHARVVDPFSDYYNRDTANTEVLGALRSEEAPTLASSTPLTGRRLEQKESGRRRRLEQEERGRRFGAKSKGEGRVRGSGKRKPHAGRIKRANRGGRLKQTNRFVFVLERTHTGPVPHAPGLIIGEKPIW